MLRRASRAGLTPPTGTPPRTRADPADLLTEEAAITPSPGETLRIELLAPEDTLVAQGAPVARLRDHPQVVLAAPMAGRVASVSLRPGRRLSEIVLFREADGGRHRFETAAAARGEEAPLRALMQEAGLWPALRSRPFGHMPAPGELPAAIFVMAVDTRPLAPDPRQALEGREEDFARGLEALAGLTGGPVHLCQAQGAPLAGLLANPGAAGGRLRVVTVVPRHPQGLPGLQIHARHPARIGAPVWDIHAEDAAALGALLAQGYLPETRLVSLAGPALTEPRLLRCQPGADLRGLSHGAVRPGPYRLLSGSPLDGREAHWLAPRARQVSVMGRSATGPRPHWFRAALTRAARPLPVIPTAALDQALGAALPAAALLRALASGDDETLVRLGGLSLLEEDLALADYVTDAHPRFSALLRGVLDRIEAEEAP